VIEKKDRSQEMGDSLQGLVCLSYVAGIRDGVASEIALAKSENKSVPTPYCLNSGVDNGQLVRIALKYIKDHPEWANHPTSVLVMGAWEKAFPCRWIARLPALAVLRSITLTR
jgi:hypothetical protein